MASIVYLSLSLSFSTEARRYLYSMLDNANLIRRPCFFLTFCYYEGMKSNPYSKKNTTTEYGTYFNLLYSYVDLFDEHPNIYEFASYINDSSIEKLEKMGAKRIFICDYEELKDSKPRVNNMETCFQIEDALVFLFRKESLINYISHYDGEEPEDDQEEEEESNYKGKILYQKPETLEKVLLAIDRQTEMKKRSNVHLLCSRDGMLGLQRFKIKLPQAEIDLKLNYGDEVVEKFDKITSYFHKNTNGLILLSGDPGTGKSTFIKYLTTKTNRKVIYLSSGAAEHLTSPDFMSFIMRQRNSILLLEDAEKVLRSRDTQDNPAISNILNITDGILGDCLNTMVIATFNIDRDKIDSALVRKGRLILEHHFKPLSIEDSNRLLESIGSAKRAEKPMSLAEIYNQEDNFHEEKKKGKVGF